MSVVFAMWTTFRRRSPSGCGGCAEGRCALCVAEGAYRLRCVGCGRETEWFRLERGAPKALLDDGGLPA